MGGNRKALARLERLLKNSNVDAFEGAHLQVRHCKPFISVITGGFSPEESAVSFQHDYFSRSLGTKLRKKRSELRSGLDYGGTEAAAKVCDERLCPAPLTSLPPRWGLVSIDNANVVIDGMTNNSCQWPVVGCQ
jgi:hypothetical protein